MKKIGRQVLFIGTSENNPRNGEGAFIQLSGGGIMYAFTEYVGDSWSDDASANISAVVSYDCGETWTDRRVLLYRDAGASNFMSVSLVNMLNGDIGLFYLRKDKKSGGCTMYLVRSEDDGRTWSNPVRCLDEEGYFVTNNDRVIRLQSGKLIYPINRHVITNVFGKGELNFVVSEDDGRTWHKMLDENIHIPAEHKSTTGLQETGVFQYDDGILWAWSRTDFGCQYECFSQDEGKTWTVPEPNPFFSSPPSPMLVKRTGQCVAAVFNPIPNYTTRDWSGTWGRSPYICAVSKNGGKTFEQTYYLEDDFNNGYCYPAIFSGEDYFLVGYYHSAGSGVCLNSTRITKVYYSELF